MQGGDITPGTNVGSVFFNIKANQGAFTRQVKSAGSAAESIMGKSMGKVGAAVAAAFSVKVVTAFAKECIDLGSDLAEVQNVVDVTFKDSAGKINAWAKTTATAFGTSELQAKQFSGTLGAMLKSMGLTTDAALSMSTRMVGLAGDMASFYNLDVQTAFEKIRSGISGETEPLKQLGINMSVANLEAFALSQGITKAYNAMSQSEAAMLRYNYLLSVTADAQGDFSRTSGSWANQVKILSLQFDTFKATIGGVLVQALTPLIRLLNEVMTAANRAASALASLFGSELQGGVFSAACAVASTGFAAEAAADSIGSTGTAAQAAAKKIRGAFASFDEINVLNTGAAAAESLSSSGSAAGTGLDIGTTDLGASQALSETENKLDSLKAKLNGFFKGFAAEFEPEAKVLRSNINSLKVNAKKAWSDIKSLGTPLKNWASNELTAFFKAYTHTAAQTFNGLFDSVNKVFTDIWNVAAFPALNTLITVGLPTVTQFVTRFVETTGGLRSGVKEVFDAMWQTGAVPALKQIYSAFTDTWLSIQSTWQAYGEPVFNAIDGAITNIKTIVLNAWNQFISPCWNELMDAVDEIWAEHLKPLVTEFNSFVAELVLGATDIYNKFIAPVVMWVQDKFYPVFRQSFNMVLNVVKPVVKGIIDAVSGVITYFKGCIQFISGVFTGDWEKAWLGIKNMFGGIWKEISSLIKTPINAICAAAENLVNNIIFGINKLIQGFNKIQWNVPDWVPSIGGKSVGFNIKQISQVSIPRLAEGGWVAANTPRLVMVGDNKREGEIIAPESKITQAVEKANTKIQELKLRLEVVVSYPDGRRIIKQINQAQLEAGKILLEV